MSDPDRFFPGFPVPALIPPTSERVARYTDPQFDYGAYLKDLRERGPREGGEIQLENIITQCIEGEFADALLGLENYSRSELDDPQQIAFLRLLGGLYETLGDSERSRDALQEALRLSQALRAEPSPKLDRLRPSTGPSKGQVQDVRQFMRRELSMQLETLDVFKPGQFERYEAARKIDTPAFLGYQEYARIVAASDMIEVEYQAVLRGGGGFTAHTGNPQEVSWSNLAMWLAYTCGDTRRARFARLVFAQWSIAQGLRGTNHRQVAEGVKELIHARQTNLNSLLDQVGYLVHALIDVNILFREFRPLKPGDVASEPIWRILNDLVETMVGYANDATLEILRDTYSEGLKRFMRGETGLAAGTTFSISYFVKAYAELGPRVEDLQGLLGWMRERQYAPETIQNLWSLFAQFDWDDHAEAAPLAAETVEVLKHLYPAGEEDAYGPLLNILYDVVSPEQRADLDQWALQTLKGEARLDYFFLGTHPTAVDMIFPELGTFIHPYAQTLRETKANGALRFGGPVIPSYLPIVLANYRNVDADPARIAILEDLLDALRNPFIHSRFKLDGYSAIARSLAFTSETVKAAVRRALEQRPAALELSRQVERGFFGTIGRPVDAQLGLMRLRAEAGIPLTDDDLPLLTVALADPLVLTRRLAVEAVSTALHAWTDAPAALKLALAAQLYGRMYDENAVVRQYAASGAVYGGLLSDSVWQRGLLQRAVNLIAQDQPGVGASLLRTVEQEIGRLEAVPDLELLVEAGRLNAHRAVREATTALASRIREAGAPKS